MPAPPKVDKNRPREPKRLGRHERVSAKRRGRRSSYRRCPKCKKLRLWEPRSEAEGRCWRLGEKVAVDVPEGGQVLFQIRLPLTLWGIQHVE